MSTAPVVTRFAPSPTGYLHIGGARTALFNWLFARANKGKFLLRIEDTDRERSTPEATAAIFEGLEWLGLLGDEEPLSQFERRDRHAEVARQMVDAGTAYRCYATVEEIEAFREKARAEGAATLFQSPWRDADPATAPDLPYVIRLKAPREGKVEIRDHVQGKVVWKAETMDDLVLLRSDGTPTYMLAVVVDDHDMGITHVIRGDDHLINAGRQALIYRAMDWDLPEFAHIPLIHGEDGKKLSKRHGAVGVSEYRAMGYMAEAMRNYLARLGWSHGNDELFSTEQAIEWFSLKGIGKSPARLDFKKLDNVSAYHIKTATDEALFAELLSFINFQPDLLYTEAQLAALKSALPALRERSKRLPDVLAKARFVLEERPLQLDERATQALDNVSRRILKQLTYRLQNDSWTLDSLEASVKAFAEAENLKLGAIAQPLRAALAGTTASPSVFDMMVILGKKETLARLGDVAP
jgi:glutamyl-tRNA synthetase